MSDIPSILLSQDAALNEKRVLLEELRLRREHEIVDRALEYERERLRWDAQQTIQESFTVNGQKFMTYADSIPPGFGFDASGSGMPNVVMTEPNVTDTETGADPPKYRTEQDLSRYRAMARFVTSVHCPGVGIIENLQNYVIGHGFTYEVRTKLGSRPPEGLMVAVQAFVDRFLDDNDWTGDLDRELLSRAAVDGEFFVDLLGDRDGVKSGRPRIELVEPHFVTDCGNWEEIQSRHQIPTNFTFGVHSHATKPWLSFGYSIQGSGAWRYGAKSHLVHHRQNSSRNAKRGVSDFFPAWEWLESQARLLRNTAAGAAELSAIAYILKMSGASESRVQSMLSSRADVTFTGPNGQTYYKQWKPPGSVVNAPAGSEYEPGPAGSERGNAFLQVVQGILRQVASRWCMSEGMISSDDSNNNMASSVVAGSRFHRFIMGRQAMMSNCFSTIIWKAIFLAYNAGAFARYGFSPHRAGGEYQKLESLLELKIECPPADELGKAEQDAIYATRVQAGVMSKTTWRSKVGLDDDVERQNLKRELAESQPPTAGMPESPAVDGTPEIHGKAPLEKRVDPKEELLSRPIQEAFCPTGKDGGIDNSCSSKGEGSGASPASSAANPKVHAWAVKKFGSEEKAKAFTSWFGDSKVVDEDGNPLVVYHGTSDEISEFDLDHPNRKDTGWLGTGVYVTTAVDIANSYANLKPGRSYPNVMPLYVKLENPYRAKLSDKQRLQIISQSKGGDAGLDAADAWTRQLKAMGHDGVILDFPASLVGKSQASKEIVVFNPSSVKSASGNKGTFNSASPKITESASSPKYSYLMAMFSPEDRDAIRKVAEQIDPSDWAEDGREDEPHCTVKYGFLTQDASKILPFVEDQPTLALTLGGLSLFENSEHDVLKLDVVCPELVALNKSLSEGLPHADSHPTYVPHVTIGYLKPGTGAKYAGKPCDVSGRVVPVKSLVFSPAEGNRVTIPLRRMAAEAFCPTGKDGGIDNSCSSRDGDGSSDSAIKSVERGLKVSDTAAKFRDSEFLNRLRQIPATKMVSATPDAFLKAQEGMARSAYLTQHSSETLQQILSDGGKLWVSEDGKVGYALTNDGDIQNLFNNGGKNGEGKAALLHAIQNGAKTLDCFDGFLPRLYHQFGFRAYKSLPFADEYAPDGWKYHEDGRPDVVMMVFAGDSREPERVAERAGQQSKYSDPARVFGYERDIREVEQGRHWIASEEAVRGRELGTETGRKPVEGRRGSVRSWTAGRVVSEDTPSVLALATAANAAEVLSIRRTCRTFVEQYGVEGMRQVMVEAFCPTGEGGGVDNSCSSRDGGSALADPAVKSKVDRIKTQILDAQKQLKAAHARKSKHGIRRGKERLQNLYRSLGKMASKYDDGQPGSGGFEAPMPPHGGYIGKFVAGDGGERTESPKNDQSMKGGGAIGNAFAAHEMSSAATGKMRTPFSTKESVYKAALETLDKSSDSYQAVLDMGKGLTEALGAKSLSYDDAKSSAKAGSREPVVLIAPPKGEKRATEKVEDKYKGDWSRLTDVARATVLVPMKDIPSTIEKLRVEVEERGWKIEPGSVDDRFSKPLQTGYRDVSMLLRAPNGMLAELQVNTHEMWLAKEGDGHRLYEEYRTIDEKEVKTPAEIARAQQLSKQMSDLYDRAYQEMVRSSENTHSGRGYAGESAVSRQRLLWEYP